MFLLIIPVPTDASLATNGALRGFIESIPVMVAEVLNYAAAVLALELIPAVMIFDLHEPNA